MKALLIASLSLATPAVAQYIWDSPSLPVVPPPRDTHAITSDPVSGMVVLFGGVVNNSNQLNDTWQWDGSSWTLLQPATSPSARESHWMAPDGQGGVVMFGGEAFYAGGTLNDTWRLHQGQWTQLSPATSPPPRRYHRMVSTGTSIVLFGGFSGSPVSGNKDDTWEWDGTTWSQRFPAHRPLARHGHAMAYDSARDRVVLFGGRAQGNQYPHDTWEWDGNDWIQVDASTPNNWARFTAFDPVRSRVVSFGGVVVSGSTATSIDDTWLWDGTIWTQEATPQPNPGARWSPIVWSPLSGGLLMHGGHAPNNDTWVSVSSSPASYTQFGAGCNDPFGGTPSLAGVSGGEPRLGTTSWMRVSGLPASVTVPILVLGTSNTMDPGPPAYELPVDLGPLGWPGCQQLISDDVLLYEITVTGQADFAMDIPLQVSLIGYQYHAQAFVLYTPSGVAVSNGLTGTVGY